MNNLQKIIAHVRDFLVKQGARSEGFNSQRGISVCTYRGNFGRMCAVGCLIPDEIYQADMEYKHVGILFSMFPQVKSQIISKFELSEADEECLDDLLDLMQTIHDDGEVSNWENRFNELIMDYGVLT